MVPFFTERKWSYEVKLTKGVLQFMANWEFCTKDVNLVKENHRSVKLIHNIDRTKMILQAEFSSYIVLQSSRDKEKFF